MNKKRQQLLFILIGFALLCIPVVTSPDFNRGVNIFSIPPFQRNFLGYLLLLIYFYLNYFLFIPKFYSRKKWLIFGCITICCFAMITFLPEILIGIKPMARTGAGIPPESGFGGPKQSFIFQFAVVFILSLLLRIQHEVIELKNQKIAAELSYLKAKINPHFLFNTLNSLYALALSENKQTPKAILKLSSLMRYVVSESESEKVPLSKEITYIEDYIDLQKLRFSDKVNFSYLQCGDPSDLEIAPLILINYIENAFKFGLDTEKKSMITIDIKVLENKIILLVQNSIQKGINMEKGTTEGLTNAKSRLELLYPGNYTLETKEKNNQYSVNLEIQLK